MSAGTWNPALLRAIEESHSRAGKLPEGEELNYALYRADIAESNARKAEALAFQTEADPLLRIRALLLRGRIEGATKLIESSRALDASQVDPVELLTEEARLCSALGDWQNCRELATLAIERGPGPTSLLTLSQIRASARFELGEMMRAIEDLDTVESLATLFPESVSGRYAGIQRAKIVARDLGAEAGLAALTRIWANLISATALNADVLLALLRTEIDIRRLARLPHVRLAEASWAAAEAVGDRLYSALARLDLYIALDRNSRGLRAKLSEDRREFERVDRLLCEMEGHSETISASAASMLVFAPTDRESVGPCSHPMPGAPAQILFLPSRELVIHLNPWRVESLCAHPRVKDALVTLARGALTKEGFFQSVWSGEYSPLRHDNRIYSLLNRCKSVCGITVPIVDGRITLKEMLACVD